MVNDNVLPVAVFAITLALVGVLVGCSGEKGEQPVQQAEAIEEEQDAQSATDSTASSSTEDAADNEAPDESFESNAISNEVDAIDGQSQGDELTRALDSQEQDDATADELTDEQVQMNSLAMLNYLTVLAQDVTVSKGSKLKLEAMYTDLFDNTRADKIDRPTHDEILDISDTIEDYRMLDVKRERLEYLYEQSKAAAMRDAVPDPVALLGVVHARSFGDLLFSIGYMAVDSFTGYKSAVNDASLQYLTEGWELDDEQAKVMHAQRKSMFTYMWDMVNEYDLPGDLALSNGDVKKLVEWKNNSNAMSRIQFLESSEETYRAYGGYWLILAGSYYEIEDYQKCLDSMDTFEEVRTTILRKDHDYAAALPLAIASAEDLMDDTAYQDYASSRVIEIVRNSEDTNWELRYLAAQIYIELYSISGNETYLQNAYKVVLNNVNSLVGKQREQDDDYLSVIVDKSAPAGATKEQKKEIDKYNKKLREERKTALPPVYQPLLVNCDLLFALADKLELSETEWARIDGILHPEGEAIFLTKPLDERYRIPSNSVDEDSADIILEETKITLPASLLSDASNVVITKGKKAAVVPGEWTCKKVKRGKEYSVDAFEVILENKDAKGCYNDGETVTVTISDGSGSGCVERIYQFKVSVTKRWLLTDVSFERV